MHMTIKKMCGEEVDKYRQHIVGLLKMCIDVSFEFSVSDEFFEEKMASLKYHLDCDTAYLFGAFIDGKICGVLWAYELNNLLEHKFHIAYVAVFEWARGTGVYRSLMKAAEEQARDLGISVCELIVANRNGKVIDINTNKIGYRAEQTIMKKELR